ncbi:hypothetical protein KC318_g2065 [Hortaea werneckii]|nr:hypothetical protein KC334_g1963 [Hortaea werneckii]KAI7022275.1 hypothetical protein KC355_g2113 [Hortaea werneckii]KAI7202126.1 hypothetical protein KC324_g1893 [Hortaea werneckii]KAI7592548.1 hypothetical protein KC316_g2239 [Hortaea werneckii]KAI7673716.1 hypothetical protein KC318_g2065 [Hortaea werneckii]
MPKPYSLGAAVLSFVAGASGQYTFGAIASCAELDCGYPFSRNENESCIIKDHEYRVNGMVPFESPLYSQDLTWTVAQSYMEFPDNSTITTVKDYYLGTPPDLDLTSEQRLGCALFFVDSNATFPTPPSTTDPYANPPGQCPSVLGSECIKALRSRAADAATNNRPDSSDDLYWGQIEAKSLTAGPQAPQSPAQAQNASTNCHPVIPSYYDLALTLNYSKNYPYSGPGRRALLGVNGTVVGYFEEYQAVPILTLFLSAEDEGQEGSDEPKVDISCLQAPPEMYGYRGSLTGGAGRMATDSGSLQWVLLMTSLTVTFMYGNLL